MKGEPPRLYRRVKCAPTGGPFVLVLSLAAVLFAGLLPPGVVAGAGAASGIELRWQTNLPAAPANLVAKPRSNWTYLDWDDPNDASITKYQFRRSTDGGKTWPDGWIDISGGTEPYFNLAYTFNGTTYTVEVRAVNNNGAGAAASVTFTPWPPAPAPKGFTATPGDKQLKLTWNDPRDWRITKYWMRTSTDGGSSWTDWFDVPGSSATTTSHTLRNLTNGTRVQVQLQAVRNVDYGGYAASAAATPKTPSAPDAPKNARAAAGNSSVTLSWTNPNDATITRYQYRVSDDSGNTWDPDWTDITSSGANTTSYTVTGLTNGTTYRIQVRAVNNIGNSAGVSTVATPNPPRSVSGSGTGGGSGGGGGGGGVEESPPGASDIFTDIRAGIWYEYPVTWMIENNITRGCTPTMFCPDQNLTRQQFVTFLWRAAGQPTPEFTGSQAFSDIEEGIYSDQAIGWAVANDTTRGCTPGSFGDETWQFCPTQHVTRGEMATLLYRHTEATYQGSPPHYTDVEPDAFYTTSITWLTDFVVVPGCDVTLWCPNRAATRAEAALFINGVAIRPHIWGPNNTSFTPQ